MYLGAGNPTHTGAVSKDRTAGKEARGDGGSRALRGWWVGAGDTVGSTREGSAIR